MTSSKNGTLNDDSIYRIRQLFAYLVANRSKIRWFMEGQAIRGQISRGKYADACVCPVTAAYHLLYNLYSPPKIANSVAGMIDLKKEDAVRLSIACDYEDDDIYGYPLRQFVVQSLLWNFE